VGDSLLACMCVSVSTAVASPSKGRTAVGRIRVCVSGIITTPGRVSGDASVSTWMSFVVKVSSLLANRHNECDHAPLRQ